MTSRDTATTSEKSAGTANPSASVGPTRLLLGGGVVALIAGLVGGAAGGGIVRASTSDGATRPGSAGMAVEDIAYRAAAAAENGNALEAISLAGLAGKALGPAGEGVGTLENVVRQRIFGLDLEGGLARWRLARLADVLGDAASRLTSDPLRMRLVDLECAVLEQLDAGARSAEDREFSTVPGPAIAPPAALSPDALTALLAPFAERLRAIELAIDSFEEAGGATATRPDERGDSPAAFVEAATKSDDRYVVERLLDSAVSQLVAWPDEADDLILSVTARGLLERFEPVERLEWLRTFSIGIDNAFASSTSPATIQDLLKARELAAAKFADIADAQVAALRTAMLELAARIESAGTPMESLSIADESDLMELDSVLFDLGLTLTDPTVPVEPEQASRCREAADRLLAAVTGCAERALDDLANELDGIVAEARSPRDITLAAPGSLGPAAAVVAELDRIGNVVFLLPLTDLPFVDIERADEQLGALRERLTALFESAAEAQRLRYESWALLQMRAAVETDDWPERLGSIDNALLSPATSALWSTTLNERLESASDAAKRYEYVQRQLRIENVSPERM